MDRAWRRLVAIGLALVVAPSHAAFATTYVEVEFRCPIGGEKFKAPVVASSSSWGQRPDGRAYGTLPVYPLTECPGNGFILYDESIPKAELDTLTPLVASSEFQAMRHAETPHYRLWWLYKALGRDQASLALTLMQAAWETDDNPMRKRRYQQAMIDAVDRIGPAQASELERLFVLRLRAANAWRELGEWDRALAAMDALGQVGWKPAAENAAPLDKYLAGLRALVLEHNANAEPLNLMPARMAAMMCGQRAMTPSEESTCKSPEIVAERQGMATMAPEEEARKAADAAKAAARAASAAAHAWQTQRR